MNLPDFLKTKAFWEAVSLIVSGLLALLVFFGKVDAGWAIPSAVILTWVTALLRMFRIELELQVKALKSELQNLKFQLLQQGVVPTKPSKKLNK
jgi:hypothetical protein